MTPLLELQHVSKIYRGGDTVKALDDVSLTIDRGEFVAVVGQSGSGKSTLMNILGCLDVPTKGRYLLAGQDMSRACAAHGAQVRSRQIGFIFQGFHLLSDLTALENVELPLIYRGMNREERRTRALNSLRRVGLAARVQHRPAELSGGQQQRVAIARALAASPPLILADEPTGNLDSGSGKEIMRLLHDLHHAGHTVVLITHDDTVAASAERRIVIRDGRVVE
ncbi:MAG: ABC transporter ATP-binding protein [Clostridia bacterium]|nr:ABC transporter ATP-binding protein [Clostridia bacterium]